MKERPILMNGDMVRAVLAGKKTQTRRVIKPQPTFDGYWWAYKHYSTNGEQSLRDNMALLGGCPFGNVGDRLWVRETISCGSKQGHEFGEPVYAADGYCDVLLQPHITIAHEDLRWTPSIHMPKWASRITLEITDVRVQRVNEISEEDALVDGGWSYANCPIHKNPVRSFSQLWDSIYASLPKLPKNAASKRYQRVKSWLEKNPGPSAISWQANPWVWVITFKRIDQ